MGLHETRALIPLFADAFLGRDFDVFVDFRERHAGLDLRHFERAVGCDEVDGGRRTV